MNKLHTAGRKSNQRTYWEQELLYMGTRGRETLDMGEQETDSNNAKLKVLHLHFAFRRFYPKRLDKALHCIGRALRY